MTAWITGNPVRFTAHRGLFLRHCHNLEHKDVRMMINVLV